MNRDDGDMDATAAARGRGETFLQLYDTALPQVYGYLLRRCGSREAAEELTSETFLAAVDAARKRSDELDVAWLIGVARHKLADHWRTLARDQRNLHAVASDPTIERAADDPWDTRLDALHARAALDRIAPQHRAALTLRYVDDLPVPDVAALLGRTVHATEALLVRARREFRTTYTDGEGETR